MRFEQPKTYSISLGGWGFWLGSLALAALLTSVGLGWLVTGLVALLLFLLSLPVLVLLAFRWWARRWITTDRCPVCGSESQAIEGSHFFCPNCGEPLFVADGRFYRQTPPGTIDVEPVEEGGWELTS
ncbi:hypothetical protein [Synechococcus sp. JA-2-3B'a(2-13)]|uniref:hypothetical protein n=1 Tax=Synechococcus sp. (strain JA-2-3B'a(2-13)) TaxID=321332 RepID=UPI00006951F3|nr:hypothetical protein [Synechococcus sp. JA-2-3B'a(2-13)]ABD03227.1 conserved hypothetical protein [Synechococcus sp. JA-2-3B'a(2-13)]